MPLEIPEVIRRRLLEHLHHLYDPGVVPDVAERLASRLERFLADAAARSEVVRQPLSEKTAVLITYADQITEPAVAPLRTLADTAHRLLQERITHIHILPFFPYSSDDGFSVVNYEAVNPSHGTWDDVHHLAERFELMFDLVINHVSSQSRWFQGFLADEPEYRDYFITVPADADLSSVVRPRALPLLTEVETAAGPKKVWTTFSADQIDLNYANPEVLLRVLDILLKYVEHGARWVRLDAVAFLWKEIGDPCIHCLQTHHIVKLLRTALDAVAPGVLLITETNVPHDENIQYFGNGRNEAQMVYQFSLPPLVVDAFLEGSAASLRRWAQTLQPPPGDATFFNFLASHDGIGLRPVEGLIPQARIEAMAHQTLRNGGRVSYRLDPDGRKSAYELNISFIDVLCHPDGGETLDVQARKFLTAQAIMLGLAGVPGIYAHSLFGSRSWGEGVDKTGENRAINREKLNKQALLDELRDPTSLRSMIFGGYLKLLHTRAGAPAFHPQASQRIVHLDDRLFCILRDVPTRHRVLCLSNVSSEKVSVSLEESGIAEQLEGRLVDLLGSELEWTNTRGYSLTVRPYDTLWVTEATA